MPVKTIDLCNMKIVSNIHVKVDFDDVHFSVPDIYFWET